MTIQIPYAPSALPVGVRSRFIDNTNGLLMHILEAGYEGEDKPVILLLHGFPELAYSWRKVIPVLAKAGFHVIAPDLRGYGRTLGWGPVNYGDDLGPFNLLNTVRDSVGLINALGYKKIAGVVGHDYGASVAAWCALVRPDIFSRCVLMSAPFDGPPKLPSTKDVEISTPGVGADIHQSMRELPRPRKHYHWYYSTEPANTDMTKCPQGIHAFLRAYYHHKSADWKANKPHKLEAWVATELEKMPTYYIMDLDDTMPQSVEKEMPSRIEINSNAWLTENELSIYAEEYTRNGFQGGLNWYRRGTTGLDTKELEIFSGKTIDIPSCFISGTSDWGVFQRPGAAERMRSEVFTKMNDFHLVSGAGHWVQQEQSEETCRLLLDFFHKTDA
ncbi:alpha/beta fold hydrolase [Rhodospirillaceae bacterium]|nr:alpha/beta fold hydrolase [Rhodospirillaceae bacterium]MBT6305774.1 alpha/beta fold hydrolase [Rhodospirillaceae bacterium]MBT7730405.1 alpha/beta fold hydrolase [Rhodospirillaceae bacterium]MDC1441109.1 alpha/beta fold hydrolase [Rhodospirillaceae bacterium]